jgi:hypothetical protein
MKAYTDALELLDRLADDYGNDGRFNDEIKALEDAMQNHSKLVNAAHYTLNWLREANDQQLLTHAADTLDENPGIGDLETALS